jgi:hypothetical protein
MAKRKPKTLTREEYEERLKQGQQFRDAYLYETQHAPADAEFYYVILSSGLTKYKRRIK